MNGSTARFGGWSNTFTRLAVGVLVPVPLALMYSLGIEFLYEVSTSSDGWTFNPPLTLLASLIGEMLPLVLWTYAIAIIPSVCFAVAMEFAVLSMVRSAVYVIAIGLVLGFVCSGAVGLIPGWADRELIEAGAFAGAATSALLVLVRPLPPPRDEMPTQSVTSSAER